MDLRALQRPLKERYRRVPGHPVRFDVDAPEASAAQLAALAEKTERYRTVFQTLTQPPPIRTTWREEGVG